MICVVYASDTLNTLQFSGFHRFERYFKSVKCWIVLLFLNASLAVSRLVLIYALASFFGLVNCGILFVVSECKQTGISS